MGLRDGKKRGFTLLEVLISITIIFILASVAMPLSKLSQKRRKEIGLRRELRIIRTAIDEFKKDWDTNVINHAEVDFANEETGYPKTIETLVELIPLSGPQERYKKYLRRIPKDPLAPSYLTDHGWGLRCFTDEPDSTMWCGDDVYDVYSQSDKTAIDESMYSDW